jgi:DNA invertase Pin-like site-specific DNA recombinase
MNRLVEDIRAGVIHTVVATGCDRIARGFSIMTEWLRLLQETDVQCISLENGRQDIKNELIDFNELLYMLAHR